MKTGDGRRSVLAGKISVRGLFLRAHNHARAVAAAAAPRTPKIPILQFPHRKEISMNASRMFSYKWSCLQCPAMLLAALVSLFPLCSLAQAESGAWMDTDSLITGRFGGFTATQLADGRVLVAGGFGTQSGPVLDVAELFDPATATWTATGPMSTARAFHTAALLADGRVLVSGGNASTSGFPIGSSSELYDPLLG